MDITYIISLFVSTAQAATEGASAAEKTGALGTLGLNWKIFLAQLVNFSIVLFLLTRYVFKPIAKKLQERKQKIDQALKDAEELEIEKNSIAKIREEELSKVRDEAANIIEMAGAEAQEEKKKILEEARIETQKILSVNRAQMQSEEEETILKIKKMAAEMVATTAEKFLKEKITEEKDKKLINELLGQIKQ